MKNKTGIIFTLILLSSLIFILTIFLVRYLATGRGFSITLFGFPNANTNTILDKTFAFDEVQEINLSQEFGDISIVEGSNDTIHLIAYGKDTDEVQWNLTNNKLTIQSSQERNAFFNTRKTKLVLYLPSSYENIVTLDLKCGNIEIEDFTNASFTIDCNAGNIEMGKVPNATVKCDCGDIEIEEITNRCNLKVNAGNIQVTKLSLQEDSTMKTNMGNIEIEEIGSIYVDAKVDLGNLTLQKNDRTSSITLTAECNCGNITIGE